MVISGTGKMNDYFWSNAPFLSYQQDIKYIEIKDGVTSIGNNAFYGCSSIESITIPDSVTFIHNWAFARCICLKDVYYSGSESQWEGILIGIDNECLKNTTIHYNSTGDVSEGSDISDCIITLSPTSYVYDGTEKKPSVSVKKSNGEVLIENTDYTVSYNNNVDVGNAVAIVRGIGKFSGEKRLTFSITANEKTSNNISISNRKVKFNAYTAAEGNQDYAMMIKWGWEYFLSDSYPSDSYNNDLAIAGVILSRMSEVSQSSVEEMLVVNGSDASFGLKFDKAYSINYNNPTIGEPAVTFAYKNIVLDGKTKTVIAVVARGTSNVEDFITDLSSVFGSFSVAANYVRSELDAFMINNKLGKYSQSGDSPIFYLTGHSLGGAVSNILSEKLGSEYGQENVYCYTFAAPNCYSNAPSGGRSTFNLCNTEDIVK